MKIDSFITWEPDLTDLSKERKSKPREIGCTMVMDKGLGLTAFEDLCQLSGEYIDFLKLGFGTAAITPQPILQKKLNHAQKHYIHLYPGGTFFEIAWMQKYFSKYINHLCKLGFSWVEISDGTISISDSDRSSCIQYARSEGLQVLTEVGKKKSGSVLSVSEVLKIYEQDLQAGASFVIMEGRETGKNIGMFDREGKINTTYLSELQKVLTPSLVIWEAPQKDQQVELFERFGVQTNLGNIAPHDVLSVESLRRGLRSDTLSWWT
ncbi:phosphosulfolactate synthase [Hazenella coriacea]|uniref:Phosphosulfolactate synthase n=1 Tax=Hazenella coriacea TaxID=1179467 RepID=A0A4R3L9M3_9BACL|nr:phosphosulfolactate synthase [Hazenella coriacea]TCS96399.1 phosphosulfolactate synthase [Hazenella coriacea]